MGGMCAQRTLHTHALGIVIFDFMGVVADQRPFSLNEIKMYCRQNSIITIADGQC